MLPTTYYKKMLFFEEDKRNILKFLTPQMILVVIKYLHRIDNNRMGSTSHEFQTIDIIRSKTNIQRLFPKFRCSTIYDSIRLILKEPWRSKNERKKEKNHGKNDTNEYRKRELFDTRHEWNHHQNV